jgi:hypothetical protein
VVPSRRGWRHGRIRLREETLDGDLEPYRRKVGSSASALGILAPFQPGISNPGLTLVSPNNSDRITAYLSTDRYRSSLPLPSAAPPRPSNVLKLVKEDGKSLVPALGEHPAKPRLYLCWKSRTAETSRREESPRAVSFFRSSTTTTHIHRYRGREVDVIQCRPVCSRRSRSRTHTSPFLSSARAKVERGCSARKLACCVRSLHEDFVTSRRGFKRGGEFIEYEEQSDIQPVNKTHWVAQQREGAYELTTQYHSPAERGMEPIWGVATRVMRWERSRGTRFET